MGRLDEKVERHLLGMAQVPGLSVQIRTLGGAIVDADASAFANRHQSAVIIGIVWGAGYVPILDDAMAAWRRHFIGAYVNFDADGGRDITELASR